jgi:hypothetical protein
VIPQSIDRRGCCIVGNRKLNGFAVKLPYNAQTFSVTIADTAN